MYIHLGDCIDTNPPWNFFIFDVDGEVASVDLLLDIPSDSVDFGVVMPLFPVQSQKLDVPLTLSILFYAESIPQLALSLCLYLLQLLFLSWHVHTV